MRTDAPINPDAFTETLRFAVNLWIGELWDRPQAELLGIATQAARIVGAGGDALQYQRKNTPNVMHYLARGLAATALAHPDGATFRGLHWCTARTVGQCPGARHEHDEALHERVRRAGSTPTTRPVEFDPPGPPVELPTVAEWTGQSDEVPS